MNKGEFVTRAYRWRNSRWGLPTKDDVLWCGAANRISADRCNNLWWWWIGNRENVGTVTLEQVKEIATIKMADLNTDNMEKAILIIMGTAKNMGIKVSS